MFPYPCKILQYSTRQHSILSLSFLNAFAKLRKSTIIFVMSVCPSTCDSSAPSEPIFYEIRHLTVCIREKNGSTEYSKGNKTVGYQKKWLQHVQRTDINRIPKQALQYKPKRRRHIGRPRKRWRDQHLEDQGSGNTPNPS